MEWLKDKKNLPIVAALAVVFLLGAAGLIGMELGLFSGSSSASAPSPARSATGAPGVPLSPSGMPSGPIPGGLSPGGRPLGSVPSGPLTIAPLPGLPVRTASALPSGKTVPAKPLIPANPAVGPDPFNIPGGPKNARIAKNAAGGSGMKLPLSEIIGPLNLFRIQPPAPPPAPPVIGQPGQTGPDLAANYRFSGIATGPDGSVSGILEVAGQSQTVKPGDNLPDGSLVENIQATSITLKTPAGTQLSLPLSAGDPNQGDPGQNGGQPGYPGQPGFNNGQFNNGQPPYPGQPGFNG